MDAGWSTTTSTVPNLLRSLSRTARSGASSSDWISRVIVPRLRFPVRQRLVEDLLPGRGRPVPVMRALADVQAQEGAHPADVDHHAPTRSIPVLTWASGPFARIHVMQICRPQVAGHCARPGGGRTSDLLNRTQTQGL